LLARINRAREESQTLAALRDTLLPKLVSGELRVNEARCAMNGAGANQYV
jgi:type I restriction enzyme, S subunit